MRILGVVDVVWSQDSDSLIFGCDFLIRDDRVAKEKGNTDRSKENTQKSGKSRKVIRGHEIKEKHSSTARAWFCSLCYAAGTAI